MNIVWPERATAGSQEPNSSSAAGSSAAHVRSLLGCSSTQVGGMAGVWA